MAEDTAAARERVLAARAALSEELTVLEASGRAAIDIPARIRRSPAKAAAIAGGVGFLALKGPQRIIGAARRAVTGRPAPLPKSLLPDEVEKTLRKLGTDGDKVRGPWSGTSPSTRSGPRRPEIGRQWPRTPLGARREAAGSSF